MCAIRTNLHCVQNSITDSLKNPVFRIRIRIGSRFNQFSGSGSRIGIWIRTGSSRAKMTHKNRKSFRNFLFWSAGCPLLRAKGFSCSLDILYLGLGTSKLQFLIKKISIFSSCFFQFLVIKALDLDWIRIGIHPTMLDPDPDPTQWIRIRNTTT